MFLKIKSYLLKIVKSTSFINFINFNLIVINNYYFYYYIFIYFYLFLFIFIYFYYNFFNDIGNSLYSFFFLFFFNFKILSITKNKKLNYYLLGLKKFKNFFFKFFNWKPNSIRLPYLKKK